MRRLLGLALGLCVLVAAPARAQAGATGPAPPGTAVRDSAASDSAAAPDTLRVETLGTDSLLAGPPTEVIVLSDSAARTLDSAAVAALSDTAAVDVGEGTWVAPFGRRVFRIYGGLGDIPAAVRAARLAARIEALARNPAAHLDSLRLVDGNEITSIQLGSVIVMSVTDADAEGRGMPRRLAALDYLRTIRTEAERYREQVTLRGLVRSAILAAGLLVLLGLLLRGLGRLYRWAGTRTEATRRLLLRPLRIGTLEVLGRDQVRRFGRALAGLSRVALSLILVYLFLTVIFGLFPWTQSWSEGLLEYALAPLQRLAAFVIEGAPDVLAIAVILVVVRWLMRLSDYLFSRIGRGEVEVAGFQAELAEPTRKIARFLLGILAVMLIYPYTPIVDSKVFQGLTVFLGILFSLGSSTAISNMVAGVVLTYTLAFRVGDRVKVGDTFGDVVEKTFLVTRIRTPKNEDVAVPNATVLSNHIVNYSRMSREGDGIILHTTVTIGYDVPWPEVHRLLTTAALDVPAVERTPPPFVLQTSLGDFSVAYELNAYTRAATAMAATYSRIHEAIQTRFAEAGIEILSPTYEAHRDGPSTLPDVQQIVRGSAAAEGVEVSGTPA